MTGVLAWRVVKAPFEANGLAPAFPAAPTAVGMLDVVNSTTVVGLAGLRLERVWVVKANETLLDLRVASRGDGCGSRSRVDLVRLDTGGITLSNGDLKERSAMIF